ncbi:hypothetical protein FOMPIDRAFT_1133224 [Fomitopsis schrenkii]|uniref:Uncharacterized protein n=1 Tax=Fomitopsis schrenkii TaxID=2126942 RepID=S8DQX4_FOMSC|nr:hypothetical protein FOMPIDRAFT_1133224 [Fomitopsis schrenkii]
MSASNSTFFFPAPIGGVPSPRDFPPSLFFEIAYILLIPLLAIRWSRKTSRTLVIMGVTITSVERLVSFGIRMAQANNPHLRTLKFMVNELQGGYCATFLALANDCLHIARAYLMEELGALDGRKSTKQSAVVGELEVGVTRNDSVPLCDEPKRRRCFRTVCIILTVTFVVGALCGLVSGATYHDAVTNPSKAAITQGARYVPLTHFLRVLYDAFDLRPFVRFIEAILGVIVLQSTDLLLLFALVTRPRRVAKTRILYICFICCILTISPVYRLSVMSARTTSLSISVAADPLNGHDAKALFYGLQLFPELIAAVLLLSVNVQAVYNTGLRGDWGIRDRK